jgi:hypothetical protein
VVRIYVNGVETGYYTALLGAGAVASDATYSLLLGNNGSEDRWFSGVLDEVRLSGTVRSSSWIRTSYNTQANPAAFLSYGPVQEGPTAP